MSYHVAVLRVERNQIGPYYLAPPLIHTPLNLHAQDVAEHPNMDWDDELTAKYYRYHQGRTPFENNWFFGFINIQQYLKWFDEECRKYLNENYYQLSLYKIYKNCVLYSSFQAIFLKHEAALIDKFKITGDDNVEHILQAISESELVQM